jgi:hypothetical protein
MNLQSAFEDGVIQERRRCVRLLRNHAIKCDGDFRGWIESLIYLVEEIEDSGPSPHSLIWNSDQNDMTPHVNGAKKASNQRTN